MCFGARRGRLRLTADLVSPQCDRSRGIRPQDRHLVLGQLRLVLNRRRRVLVRWKWPDLGRRARRFPPRVCHGSQVAWSSEWSLFVEPRKARANIHPSAQTVLQHELTTRSISSFVRTYAEIIAQGWEMMLVMSFLSIVPQADPHPRAGPSPTSLTRAGGPSSLSLLLRALLITQYTAQVPQLAVECWPHRLEHRHRRRSRPAHPSAARGRSPRLSFPYRAYH